MTQEGSAIRCLLWACALSVAASAVYFAGYQREPGISSLSGISMRIFANVAVLVFMGGPSLFSLVRLVPFRQSVGLSLWGVFGTLTVFTYFYAVPIVGAGLANFTNSASGVVIVAMSSLLLGQAVASSALLSLFGCAAGMLFLTWEALAAASVSVGLVVAIMAGIFAGFAYLMVARDGERNHPKTVIWAWTWPNLLVLAAWLALAPVIWPRSLGTWAMLAAAGMGTAVAQYFTILAYQRGRSAHLACLSYLAPALSFLVDSFVFQFRFTWMHWMGFACIVSFGAVLPWLLEKRPLTPVSESGTTRV